MNQIKKAVILICSLFLLLSCSNEYDSFSTAPSSYSGNPKSTEESTSTEKPPPTVSPSQPNSPPVVNLPPKVNPTTPPSPPVSPPAPPAHSPPMSPPSSPSTSTDSGDDDSGGGCSATCSDIECTCEGWVFVERELGSPNCRDSNYDVNRHIGYAWEYTIESRACNYRVRQYACSKSASIASSCCDTRRRYASDRVYVGCP